MSNFTSATPSIDAMLSAYGQYGGLSRFIGGYITAITAQPAALVNPPVMRWPAPFIVPSVGSGVAGYCLAPSGFFATRTATTGHIALEYLLGTITLNGNVASNLGSMPVKTINGTASQQTASKYLILYTKTSGTATTPTITVTYTDQDGNTGITTSIQTATTPAIGTAYIIPLAAGDTGVQAVTGISSSVTTGLLVFNIYGLLELGTANMQGATNAHGAIETTISPALPKTLCEAGEAIGLYQFGSTLLTGLWCHLNLAPETT